MIRGRFYQRTAGTEAHRYRLIVGPAAHRYRLIVGPAALLAIAGFCHLLESEEVIKAPATSDL